jgi:hypothetical protein
MRKGVGKNTFEMIQSLFLKICKVEGRFFPIDHETRGAAEDF